jgi:hypothetical protein
MYPTRGLCPHKNFHLQNFDLWDTITVNLRKKPLGKETEWDFKPKD